MAAGWSPLVAREFEVVNPATEEVAGVISMGSAEDVDSGCCRRAPRV